jgi:hypothetical protein
VRILFRRPGQPTPHRVLPNVIFKVPVFKAISDSPIRKTCLPGFSLNLQPLIELKGEAALHKLNGTLQRDSGRSKDQMKMVGHDNKFMQQVLFLRSVIQQDFNEEPAYLVALEQASFSKNIAVAK